MRSLSLVGVLAVAALAASPDVVGATTPPGDGDADDVLELFADFAAEEGLDIDSTACVSAGDPSTFVCYALDDDGAPFVAQATLTDDGADWEVLTVAAPPTEPGTTDTAPETTEATDTAPETTDTADTTADTTSDAGFDQLAFFADVFSADVDLVAGAIELTQSGSPAEAYVRFQHEYVTVSAGYDRSITPASVYRTATSTRVCVTPGTCSEITDVEVADGEVVSFSVDGNDIAERLATTGDAVVVATTALRLSVAYDSVTGGQLVVVVEVASEQGDRIDLAGATYVGPDGREQGVNPQASLGLDTTRLKGHHIALLAFVGAAPGGEIHVPVTPADGSAPMIAAIPVEAMVS